MPSRKPPWRVDIRRARPGPDRRARRCPSGRPAPRVMRRCPRAGGRQKPSGSSRAAREAAADADDGDRLARASPPDSSCSCSSGASSARRCGESLRSRSWKSLIDTPRGARRRAARRLLRPKAPRSPPRSRDGHRSAGRHRPPIPRALGGRASTSVRRKSVSAVDRRDSRKAAWRAARDCPSAGPERVAQLHRHQRIQAHLAQRRARIDGVGRGRARARARTLARRALPARRASAPGGERVKPPQQRSAAAGGAAPERRAATRSGRARRAGGGCPRGGVVPVAVPVDAAAPRRARRRAASAALERVDARAPARSAPTPCVGQRAGHARRVAASADLGPRAPVDAEGRQAPRRGAACASASRKALAAA